MDSIRRILLALPLLAAADGFRAAPAPAQGRDGTAPLLRAVARMGCGTPNARTYNLTARGARPPGSGTYAPPPQQMIVRQAELVGTLELIWGQAERGASPAGDRPMAGTWSVTPMGYCTGGRGPIQFAVIVPASDGHPARYELRGPASRILRPGAVNPENEGGEVRFMGACGRRQEVIMEIWPQQLESGATVIEPERYRWIGNVTCAAPQPPAPSDSTARATP